MKVYLFFLIATIFEATGDAVMRLAIGHDAPKLRIGLFLLGACLLTLYGTTLNLAPVEFAAVTGIYLANLFVVFQIVNCLFFRITPSVPTMLAVD